MASSFEVMDRGHAKALLQELNEQRIQGIFCDVTIVVEDSKFKAHKNVLAAFSLYFKELLTSQNLWARDPVLELREMKADIFAKILHFIYSSRVVVERLEEANELASAGHRLGIHFLEELVEVASQTGTCNDRLVCSSAQSSLSHSSDFSQVSQGTKEDNPASTGGKGLEEDIRPLELWPTDSFLTSRASRGPSFPIDLTASTSRRSGDSEGPPSAYRSQTPTSRPASTGNHSFEHSRATSTDQEDNRPPLGPEDNEPCITDDSPLNGLFHGAFLKGASQESSEETNEAAKRLYTLSTVAFRGLGFSVEEAANPGDLRALPPKDPVVTLSAPDASWGQPPADGTPEEGAGGSDLPPEAQAAPAPAGYPAGLLRCELCVRSFSSAAALTLHAKLHRAGKALSCRHCHKPFVHVKRLHTHQMLCRRADRPGSSQGAGHHHHHHHHQQPCHREEPGAAGEQQAAGAGPARPLDLMLADSGCADPARKPRGLPRLEVLTDEEHFMKVVDGHLLYFCAVCERSYMTLSSLKRHANVHSWRRKYPCRYCDKVFALAEYRTKHEVWHTGERRYQCIFCWETFVTYYNLKTHQKSFHGVDPGLTISQKTPNGGYKPKLNAFKLYRLLPMRSQKRPYKTYSHSVSGNMLKYAQSAPVTLPPESDLAALSHASPANYVHEKDAPAGSHGSESQALPCDQELLARPTRGPCPAEGARSGSPSQSRFPAGHPAPPTAADCPSGGEAAVSQPPAAFPGPEAAGPVPSVITYGHPVKSSVIVHSNALLTTVAHRHQSSVIAYNGKCGQEKGAGAPPPARKGEEPAAASAARATKKQASRDHARFEETSSSACGATNQRHELQKETRPPKPKKYSTQAKGKTMTYVAKPACAGTASEGRSAPLCQITVRIGEEAIVKRRISESDLIRDKGSTSKERRFDATPPAPAGGKRPRAGEEERERQRKTDYFLGNESGEEVSDNDTDDNLWRPYYSYKPKRRAGSFHKTRKSGWRRKLRYRHSARWLQRAAKGPERDPVEPVELRSQGPEPTEDEAGELGGPVQHSCAFCPERFPDRASLEQHGPCRGPERVLACPTCGKQFSALRNLRKHEQAHSAPAQLSCRFCDKAVASAKALKKHEKMHASQKLRPPAPQGPGRGGEAAQQPAPRGAEGKPPGRHACAHCPKTCKTAAALGRHQKRHLAEERPGDGPGLGCDGPSVALERAAGVARYSQPPEEASARPLGRDEDEAERVPANPRSAEAEQDEHRQQAIAPYAGGRGREEGAQETAMSPAEESCSNSAQNPTRAPRAGGEEARAPELMAPPRAGDPMSPIHQMLMLHGGELRKAAASETRKPYANASAPEAQVQEPAHPRDCSPGTSGRTAASPPPAMPRGEDAGRDSPPRGRTQAREADGRDFHTLEPMTSHEGFEESDCVPEPGTGAVYPVQEYPIPLITTGNCRSHADPENKAHAFHPGAIRFKEGDEDLAKVAFYQDPYQLVYGHQLLTGTYPYNFGHVSPLPVALNMVIRDEKGQQLPLLHRMFVYPTPCRDQAPPLPPPPLGAGGNGSHDETGRELLAGNEGAPMMY